MNVTRISILRNLIEKSFHLFERIDTKEEQTEIDDKLSLLKVLDDNVSLYIPQYIVARN